MNEFQDIVIGIAVISLIAILIIFGVMLYYAKAKELYPPVTADCPDYWLSQQQGKTPVCYNQFNLGKDSIIKQ